MKDLAENLFNFRPSGMDFDKAVQRVVMHVQTYLGDVVGEETTEDVAREECWTLAIDRANELSNDRQTAIRVAKEACHRVGYTPKGYRPMTNDLKDRPALRENAQAIVDALIGPGKSDVREVLPTPARR